MYKAIHKYPLTSQTNYVSLPSGAKVVHFGLDPMGVLCMWAIVELSAPAITRRYVILQTGQQAINGTMQYLGSCMVGPYMWHLFED